MLKTVKLQDNQYNDLIIKQIKNFLFICFNHGSHIYAFNKYKVLLYNYYTYTFIIYYLRIVWRGKAYRVRFFKKSNKFTFHFGHSHWVKFMYDTNQFKFSRIKRQSYVVIFSWRFEYFLLKNFFNNIRTYNKYNRRGIRIKKTPYIKRFGKVSQVNSILHSF